MTRFSKSRSRLLLKILLGIVFAALTPVTLHAADAHQLVDSLDGWRAKLTERLNHDVARLESGPRSQRAGAFEIRRRNAESRPAEVAGSTAPIHRSWPVWLDDAARVLSEHGLPRQFLGIAAVESVYNPAAISPKGAAGLWQFMPDTARRYGLLVEPRRDDRFDPMKSTVAAARYLKDLYAQFGDWPLALAAYNAGEGRVQRSLERSRAHDFWTLSRNSALPEETIRYVPAVLARAVPSLSRLAALSPHVADAGTGACIVYALASQKASNGLKTECPVKSRAGETFHLGH